MVSSTSVYLLQVSVVYCRSGSVLSDLSYKQTAQQAKNIFPAKNEDPVRNKLLIYLRQNGLLIRDGSFSYQGMEHPWKWPLHSRTANIPETIPDGLAN